MGVPVLGYPNYEVEPDGRIFSKITNKYLKPSLQRNGYQTVELFNENGSKRILIHRIVASAYLRNENNYPQINHKDEDKSNNSVDNLEWCSAKYNMNYGKAALARHMNIDYTKENLKANARKNGMKVCRVIHQFSKNGIYLNTFESIKEAERYLKVANSHIVDCAKGRRSSSNGYVWKYERGNDLSEYQY